MTLRFAFLALSMVLVPSASAQVGETPDGTVRIAAPAGSAGAQERGVPDLELDLHATGVGGRLPAESFHPFEDPRLLFGGTVLKGVSRNWSLGVGVEIGWVDQDWTTYVYHARVQRRLALAGGFDLSAAAGLGGLTSRLDVRGVEETETDLLVPLAVGVAWRPDPESSWGLRATFTDWVVREEEPCGCVSIGGPLPETGEYDAVHNLGISAGVLLLLGRR